MSSSVALPVQVLGEHIAALEAALTVCLANPGHKPVHKLRTETRRAEALVLLLALVPGLPEHRKEANALLRSLAKLRRAAGEVRDLDVHRKMLEEFAGNEAEVTPTPGLTNGAGRNGTRKVAAKKRPASGSSKSAKAAEASDTAALLKDAAAELRKEMGRSREKAASALLELIKERQVKTARASEKLLKVLEPAKGVTIPGADLLRDAESVLLRDGLLKPETVASLKEDDLHSVRKAAKAARYLAESLPDDPSLAEAARKFESLQEAGGQWHDALELARAARRHFGKSHELTAAYRQQRDQKLEAYRAELAARAGANTEEKKPRPAPSLKKPVSRRRAAA